MKKEEEGGRIDYSFSEGAPPRRKALGADRWLPRARAAREHAHGPTADGSGRWQHDTVAERVSHQKQRKSRRRSKEGTDIYIYIYIYIYIVSS